ncbi:hypothetical protein L484_007839 [Morus notabilis]|uniref:Uncharacterized protein n=1 Tax=Morus notabilis TaxID=981085 RepID=W9RWK9_9ROSA|nr:hypothetical protein L484_007839 [Morus notabilis]
MVRPSPKHAGISAENLGWVRRGGLKPVTVGPGLGPNPYKPESGPAQVYGLDGVDYYGVDDQDIKEATIQQMETGDQGDG